MRIFVASLATETNTFSPLPTSRQAFLDAFYAPPGRHPETPTLCSAPVVEARRRARAEGFTLIEGTSTWAEPAGLVTCSTYEGLRDEILDQIRVAMPLDVVLFGLHGAMVAQGYPDCEGDLLQRTRAIVGTQAVVGAELDPHCHLTARMLDATTVLVTFLEVPHTDFAERAAHMVDLCLRTARGEVRPEMRAFDCRAIANFATSREPGRSLVDRVKAMQGRVGILSLSIVHGFPAADVHDVGTKVIAITDGDAGAAEAVAGALGREIIAGLPLRSTARLPPAEAISRGLSLEGGPVVLADRWDNPGGGVGGDNTQMLAALLARPEVPAAVGAMWDPGAVALCRAVDPGTRLPLRIGGKATPQSGLPIDLDVTVGQTSDDLRVPFEQSQVSLGAAAAVRFGELDIVLASKRVQTFHPQVFTDLGIDLGRKKLVAVKSANHFFAAFSRIAAHVLYVDCDGPYPSDPRTIAYTRIRRPIWPLDPDPWG